jgi:hypothetical protein
MTVKFIASLVHENPEYIIKQQQACGVLNIVWNSQEFRDKVLENTTTVCSGWWKWKKCQEVKSFSSTLYSNEVIYSKLMVYPVAYIQQDIVPCRNPKVVGYEDGTEITKVCKGWDTYLDIYGVVENMAHEYCHKLGFSHSSAKDITSVPYRVGVIAGEVARKLIPNL